MSLISILLLSLVVPFTSGQVVVEYQYLNNTCSNPYFQAKINYPNACYVTGSNAIQYSNTFVQTSTVINVTANVYASSDTTCTGTPLKTVVNSLSKTCQFHSESLSNNYNRKYAVFQTNPGVAALAGNYGYILVNNYGAAGCSTNMYQQTILRMGCIASSNNSGTNHYGQKLSCNATGYTLTAYASSTCDGTPVLTEFTSVWPHPYGSCQATGSEWFNYYCSQVTAPSAAPVVGTQAPGVVPTLAPAAATQKPASAPSSSSSSSCFAGSETVALASGETRAISEINLGDEIAVATMDGTFAGYSPVIAVPHAKNSIKASFAQISTVSGRDIKMTADHLVLGGACAAPSLVQAGSLKAGECVQTVSGAEAIASISTVESEGIYTVVTKHDGLLIVNGVVASPFAVNHLVTNSFYNIVRLMYRVMPSVAKTSVVGQVLSAFGDVFTSVFA